MITTKTVPGASHYSLNRAGQLFSDNPNSKKVKGVREVKGYIDTTGYRRVQIVNDQGTPRRYHLHRLMLLTWVGKCPSSNHQARHLDGNKLNNTLSNLAWGTRKQNQMDRVATGTSNRGERHPQHKYSLALILEAREMARSKSRKEISLITGIPYDSLCQILRGDTWKWAGGYMVKLPGNNQKKKRRYIYT